MIKPRINRFAGFFWKHYIRFLIKKDFSSFNIHNEITNSASKSILVISNHFSWWDGFFIYHINEKVFKKRFHVMMLEEQLAKRRFLTTAGAFSVSKGSRKVLEAIIYSYGLLDNPKNMLLMFPQGKIESMHIDKISFEKGILKIISRADQPFQIVFSAVFINYFSNRKPQVDIFLKEYNSGENGVEGLERGYNDWYLARREGLIGFKDK